LARRRKKMPKDNKAPGMVPSVVWACGVAIASKAIHAKRGLTGLNGLIQKRLKELFEDAVEAFVFLDKSGDNQISTRAFSLEKV